LRIECRILLSWKKIDGYLILNIIYLARNNMSYPGLRGYVLGPKGQWKNPDGTKAYFPFDKEEQNYFLEAWRKYFEKNPGTRLPLSCELIERLDREAETLRRDALKTEKEREMRKAKKYFEESVAESNQLKEIFESALRASEEAKLEAERLAAEAKEALKRAEQLVITAKKAEALFGKSLEDVRIFEYMLERLKK
jgi:hypothetical protein